jgi:hypothetical protein
MVLDRTEESTDQPVVSARQKKKALREQGLSVVCRFVRRNRSGIPRWRNALGASALGVLRNHLRLRWTSLGLAMNGRKSLINARVWIVDYAENSTTAEITRLGRTISERAMPLTATPKVIGWNFYVPTQL